MLTPATTSKRPTPWSRDDNDDAVPHIADQYGDLLGYLAPAQRSGMIVRLANGYFDDWRPTRNELADIIAAELGVLPWDRVSDRQRQRTSGQEPPSITPSLRAWYRERHQPRLPRQHRH